MRAKYQITRLDKGQNGNNFVDLMVVKGYRKMIRTLRKLYSNDLAYHINYKGWTYLGVFENHTFIDTNTYYIGAKIEEDKDV